MSSVSGLSELKRFLYLSASLNLGEQTTSYAKLLSLVHAQCKQLLSAAANGEKAKVVGDVLATLKEYARLLPNNRGLDSIAFLLASIAKSAAPGDEDTTHKVYETLVQTSPSPFSLFAFDYYRSYLRAVENNEPTAAAISSGSSSNMDVSAPIGAADRAKKKERKIGRGLKKALIKWYSSKSEFELLLLLTRFKHSHSWTNKDLLKLIHMKPQNEGVDFIMKYVMFGFDKVKNDKLPDNFAYLMTFVTDLENLKTAKTGDEISALIRKNKFHKDHLPSRVYKFKEIWPALIEQMNIQDFCSNLHKFTNKDVLNTELERFIMDKILNKDSPDFKALNPIYLCMGVQTIENYLTHSNLSHRHSSSSKQSKEPQQSTHRSILERLRDHLWSLYSHSHSVLQSSSKINMRVMIVVEVNGQMRNGHTLGLTNLNPLDTSACVMLTLYYSNADPAKVTVFAASDKLTQIELAANGNAAKPDLATIERIFQGFASIEKNPTDKIYEWSLQNAKSFDAFVFLTSSDQTYKGILSEAEFYRINHSPTTKLALINLTGKTDTLPNSFEPQTVINAASSLNLCMNGWSYDHYFVLDAFLKNKF